MSEFITHKDFKSFKPYYYKDANKIYHSFVGALEYQHLLKKRIVPLFENNNNSLTEREIDNFIIDVQKIDRLYYASREQDDNGDFICVLICRVEYEKKKIEERGGEHHNNNHHQQQQQQEEQQHHHQRGQQLPTSISTRSFHVYIKMFTYSPSLIFTHGVGNIYIGTDVEVFMNVIFTYTYPMYEARQLLAEDGIVITEYLLDAFNNTTKTLDLKTEWYLKLISSYKEEEYEFKSLESDSDLRSIKYHTGYALQHQHAFEKNFIKTTTSSFKKSPWWNETQQKNFEIDVNKIDLLYSFHHNIYMGDSYIKLVCRIKYLASYVYVKLIASCCGCMRHFNCHFNCRGEGKIFISEEDSSVLTWLTTREKISAPTLQYLCHLRACKMKNNLPIPYSYYDDNNNDVLPKILQDSLKDFIRLRKTSTHNKYW